MSQRRRTIPQQADPIYRIVIEVVGLVLAALALGVAMCDFLAHILHR